MKTNVRRFSVCTIPLFSNFSNTFFQWKLKNIWSMSWNGHPVQSQLRGKVSQSVKAWLQNFLKFVLITRKPTLFRNHQKRIHSFYGRIGLQMSQVSTSGHSKYLISYSILNFSVFSDIEECLQMFIFASNTTGGNGKINDFYCRFETSPSEVKNQRYWNFGALCGQAPGIESTGW